MGTNKEIRFRRLLRDLRKRDGDSKLLEQQARAIKRLIAVAEDPMGECACLGCPPSISLDDACLEVGDGPSCTRCWEAWAMEERDDE